MGDGRPRVARAGGVNQDAHGHSAFDGPTERGDKLLPAGVVVENITDQRNGFFCGFNRREHGGKCLVAVDERMDAVAGRQRLRDDATDNMREHFQMFRAIGLRFAKVFGNPAGWFYARRAKRRGGGYGLRRG